MKIRRYFKILFEGITKIYLIIFLLLISQANLLIAQNLSDLLNHLNRANNSQEEIQGLKNLGIYYQNQKTYSKAIDYFVKAAELEKKENKNSPDYYQYLENIAYCHLQEEQYPEAISHYKKVLQYYQSQNKPEVSLRILQKMTLIYKQTKEIDKAIFITRKILEINRQTENNLNLAHSYNNLGYLFKIKEDLEEALKHYFQALDIIQQNKQTTENENYKATVLTNIGVTYTHLYHFKKANYYFNQVLNIWDKENDLYHIAETHNFLAGNHYIDANQALTIRHALKAAEIAERYNYEDILLVSYKILGDAYQKEDDLKSAQQYFKLYQKIKEKTDQTQYQSQQKLLEDQIYIEKRENDLKSLIAEKEKQILALKQTELEGQKKEQELKLKKQELALLKNKQERQSIALRNQQLEKEKIEQMLALEKQKREIEIAKQKADKNHWLAEKRRSEQENEKRAREAAEKESRYKDQQLQQEVILKRYYGIFALLASIIVLLVLIGFMNNRRQNKKLKNANKEIKAKNEELTQQAEELRIANEQIVILNQNLEKRIEEKTIDLKIQNEKLTEYAYYNAHKVRGPLARLLGLVNIILDEEVPPQLEHYVSLLKIIAEELDRKVKEINEILSE